MSDGIRRYCTLCPNQVEVDETCCPGCAALVDQVDADRYRWGNDSDNRKVEK